MMHAGMSLQVPALMIDARMSLQADKRAVAFVPPERLFRAGEYAGKYGARPAAPSPRRTGPIVGLIFILTTPGQQF